MNNMPKNIWIINEHLSTPELSTSGHSRHYSLALEFQKAGYNVSLITSSFSHNPLRKVPLSGFWKILDGNVRTMVIKGVSYQKTASKLRMFNWVLFCFLLFFIPFSRLPKPDIIVLSSTPMLPVYNILLYRFFNTNCKFIFETRDLWPLTPLSLGGYSKKNVFIRFLSHLEYLCYSRADYIVSVLVNSHKHVKKVLGEKKFRFKWISNGVDLVLLEGHSVDKQWGFLNKMDHPEPYIIGYAGTLGNANAMEYIVETFNTYFVGTKFYLVVVGQGGDSEKLKIQAKDNPNIFFSDAVPRTALMSFYSICDALYLGSRDRELYKYGVSANKIFEYMFSKTPILMSGNFPDSIIEKAQCGFMIKPENAQDIRNKIINLESLPKIKQDKFGLNGYTYLINNLTYRKLAGDYIEVFKSLC